MDYNFRTKNNINENTKAEFLYEISYLSNYKFSEPKEVESLTLKPFIEDCK